MFSRKRPFSRWHRLAQHLLGLGCVVASLLPAAAEATVQEVRQSVTVDGTPRFDPHPGPGMDTGPSNGIVRTHDSFEYQITLITSGSTEALQIRLRLPAAAAAPLAHWLPPPTQCLPGSSLSDDRQVLTCRLPDMPTAGTRAFYVRASVPGTTPHGSIIPAPDIQVFEQGQPVFPGIVPARPLTVSAAPFYDVHLEMSYAGNPRAFGYQQGSGPQGRDGFFHRPLIGLIARHPNGHGRKGVEALDPAHPVEIELDVSGYPPSVVPGTWHAQSASPALPGTQATGGFPDGCGSPALGRPSSLLGGRVNDYDRVTDNGPQNSMAPGSVANGGECRLQQADRHRITLSLHGIDTRLAHIPAHRHRSGKPVAAAEAWVANKALVLWTDLADYPERTSVTHRLRLRRLSARSLSGQPVQGDRPGNNQLQHAIRAEANGSGNLVMAPDATLDVPWASVADPLLPSYQTVNHLAPGQTVRPLLQVRNQGTQPFRDTQLCAILDRSAFDLGARFHAKQHDHTTNHRIRYGAQASGSPYFDSTESATRAHGAPRTPATQASYTRASCDSPDIRWFDTHAEAEAAGGLVFIRAELPLLPAGARSSLAINNLILRKTWASTVTVMGPNPGVRQAGTPIAPGTIIRTRSELFTPSTTLTAADTDHLEVVDTRTVSRLTQQISAGGKPVTRVPAGTVLRYALEGRYTTEFPPRPDTVTITQILPDGVRYLDGSARVGGQPREPERTADQPGRGQTTLVWRFHDQTPAVTRDSATAPGLPRIEFDAQLSRLLADGLQLHNHASIRGGPNDFDADCVHQPDHGFGDCAKASAVTLTVQSPPGFLLEKTALTPTVAPGEVFSYLLSFGAIGRELRQPDMPDIIDILPFAGDGVQQPGQRLATRHPASQFSPGAYRLSRVVPPAHDPSALVYYTHRPPARIQNDPQHPDNLLDATTAPRTRTRWCLGHELGSPGCPARIGDATAIRIRPGLPMIAANSVYEIRLELKTDPVLSHLGDLFANRAGSRPGGTLPYIESPADTHVRVQAPVGSLSGQVFADMNRNGRLDAGDWPLPGECIALSGQTAQGRTLQHSIRTDAEGRYHFGPGRHGIHQGGSCEGEQPAPFAGLLAGTYQLHRRPDLGKPYPRSGERAGNLGGTTAGHRITGISLDPGHQGQDYDFMLFPPQPTLTLTGFVRNEHGGRAAREDLVLEARQLDTLPGNQPMRLTGRSDSPGLERQSVPPGRYQLGFSPISGYRPAPWQCRSNGKPVALQAPGSAGSPVLLLDHGDQVVCHLSVHDQPTRLTLQATVTNRHGRQARPSDIRLHADGPIPLGGFSGSPAVTDVEAHAGTYRLRSDTLPHYVPGAWQCDAGSLDGDILTLAPGETATCTINHTDQPLSLTLVLDIQNQYGGTASVRDHALAAEGPDAIQGISGTRPVTVAPVRPGVYALSMPELPGYVSGKWVCSAGRLEGNLLHLFNQLNVTCRIVLKDLPTTMDIAQQVIGEPSPVPGTDGDYRVDYQISVRHQAGGEGLYSLTSQPGFDPDVQILSASLQRNQQILTLRRAPSGQWLLAERERLPIGAGHQYRLRFHVRVPYGSNSRNNRCAASGEPKGYGLWHQALLTNHSSDITPAPQTGVQACTDTPIPAGMARLSIEKTGSRRDASVGETLHYRIRIRNHGPRPALLPELIDRLPPGFRFERESLRIQNARLVEVRRAGSRELRILLDRIEPSGPQPRPSPAVMANSADIAGLPGDAAIARDAISPRAPFPDSPAAPLPIKAPDEATDSPDIIISYRVRVGVGSQEGDGINRAHLECLSADGLSRLSCSNHAQWRVRVDDGVFRQQVCLAGLIFVDCNGNAVKDPDEPGIPNVRLYLQNGSWLISDTNGQYSLCGLRPRIHVMKVDARTLPARSRLVTSSPQNGGDAESLFIDARKGMLHRADFIEGSCRPQILHEVHRRQSGSGPKDRIPRSHPSGFYMDSGRPVRAGNP